MKTYRLVILLALLHLVGCKSKPAAEIPEPLASYLEGNSNSIERIETRPVHQDGFDWTEIDIYQIVDPATPNYIVDIRWTENTTTLRWRRQKLLFRASEDLVMTQFRVRHTSGVAKARLSQGDFVWFAEIADFKPLEINLTQAEQDEEADAGNAPE